MLEVTNNLTGKTMILEVSDTELSPIVESSEHEIGRLKAQLSDTDYQVIKCYEYQLVGLTLPYDIVVIHNQRQALRDRINRLEG
jgi:hypothetical protein